MRKRIQQSMLLFVVAILSFPNISLGLQIQQPFSKGNSIYKRIDKIESVKELIEIDSMLTYYDEIIKAGNGNEYYETVLSHIDDVLDKLKKFITDSSELNDPNDIEQAKSLTNRIESLKNKSKKNPWFYFEVVLIICVIIYQLFHSRKVSLSIEELKGIFNNRIVIKNGFIKKANLSKEDKSPENIDFIEEDNENAVNLLSDKKFVKISIAETTGKGIIKRICDDINNYLLNNYGATVNFSIIKDIIDREVDIKDEEITNSITTPLYLGLAATMIGIIFGLFAMPELSGDHFSKGIDALIDGVKLAMFGSLSGLACTTILSSFFYKNAKKKVLKDKNQQISYLQAKLLPELLKAEETGISGLRDSISQFSRDAIKISTDLKETANKTSSTLIEIKEVTSNQLDIINKIKTIDITRLTTVNFRLLDKLEQNIQSYSQFANYIELMGQISTQLQDFASRTSNIDSVIKHIDSSLSENKLLIQFLSEHFKKIEQAGNAALAAVSIADSHFESAVEELKRKSQNYFSGLLDSISDSSSKFAEAVDNIIEEVKTRTEKINQNAADHESKLKEIYDEVGGKLDTIAKNYIDNLIKVFDESVPRFDDLKHLTELPAIKEQFVNNQNGKKFIDIIDGLNDSVLIVKERINQDNLLNKLSSIEETLKRKKPETLKPSIRKNDSPQTKKKEKPVTIFEALNKLFKK